MSPRLGLCAADVTSFFSWLPARGSKSNVKDGGQSDLQYEAFSPGSERVTRQNPDWLAQRHTTVELRAGRIETIEETEPQFLGSRPRGLPCERWYRGSVCARKPGLRMET